MNVTASVVTSVTYPINNETAIAAIDENTDVSEDGVAQNTDELMMKSSSASMSVVVG